MFTTPGDKEVWLGVKDDNGQISNCSSPIIVVPAIKFSIPVYSPYFQTASKGTELTYVIKVTNKGNEEDTINLSISKQTVSENSEEWWDVQFSSSSVILASEESEDIFLKIVIPKNQPEVMNKITVRGNSLDKGSTDEITIIAEDGEPDAILFMVKLFFKTPESGHYREFEIPDFAEIYNISEKEAHIAFNPKSQGDLDNTYIKITELFDGNVIKSEIIPVKFEQHSEEVITTSFDMREDSYSFSNNISWPDKDRGACILGKCLCPGCICCDCECKDGRCICEEGKCYGMAASSISYFTGEELLPSGFATTYSLDVNIALPIINDYQDSEDYNLLRSLWYIGIEDNIMSKKEYDILEENIRGGQPMIFIMREDDKIGHAVVAYRIVKDGNKSYILIYDNIYNLPDNPWMAFRYITYNNTTGELYYDDYTKFKLTYAGSWWRRIKLYSPAELYVYDSEERATGIIDSEVRNEIPSSLYDEENETITILFPSDTYRYEVAGTDAGTYRLEITSVENGEAISFMATDIPTTPNEVHEYIVDWDVLSQSGDGVTLQIDTDGDGEFEQTVTSDSELTSDEFILQIETAVDFVPDTLNLKSKGKFITAYIELPEGYDVTQINVSSIMLNNLVSVLLEPTEIGDYDNDGIPDLMVKFDRSEVQAILTPEEEVTLTLVGKLAHDGGDGGDIGFKGFDTIRVVNPSKDKE
jgi:hypothetical protein